MGSEGLACAGDALSDLLKLAADFLDLRKGRISGRSLGFELPKRLLRLLNLPLQGIILLLGDLTLLKLLVCLLCRRFQSGEFFLGLLDGVCQQLLFLPYQLSVGGIKLQEFLHVLELCLGIFDFLVDSGECGCKARGISAYLNGYSFDISSCHSPYLPSTANLRTHI